MANINSIPNKNGYLDFITKTVLNLDPELFDKLKDILAKGLLPMYIIEADKITAPILAEKLCDYFDALKLASAKSFERVIDKYMTDLDSVVRDKIAKEPKAKKNMPQPETPRARLYYEKACLIRKQNRQTKKGLSDYTRIMLCLYMAIINNHFNTIDNFDYSMNCLELSRIIDAMLHKHKMDDLYSSGRCTFIVLVLMFYYIKSKEIEGEY